MSVVDLYDQLVAEKYDLDPFGILAESRQVALDQLADALGPAPAVLDLGCGTGRWLEAVGRRCPGATLHGLDPSRAMLDIAARRCAMKSLCADALEAEQVIDPHSLDLVTMQFIFAYVEPEAVLHEARRLLKPNGLLSVVTSTFETLPTISNLGKMFITDDQIHGSVRLPETGDAFVGQLTELGFEVVHAQPLLHELSFANFPELYEFAVPSGWLVQHVKLFDMLRAEQDQWTAYFPFSDQFHGIAALARLRSL
jgi:ubiquinone/menaquinone biosynthesis C-methylase UbiE